MAMEAERTRESDHPLSDQGCQESVLQEPDLQRIPIVIPRSDATLEDQSLRFTEVFKGVLHNATVASSINFLIRSSLSQFLTRLESLQIGYSVWLCDVDLVEGGLRGASSEDHQIFTVIRNAFERFRHNFRAIDEDLSAINRCVLS
jgi:hypothetical protein